jgi:hypothetical protein
MIISSTKLFLVSGFVEDISVHLPEIESMSCEDIFLKGGTIALQGENAEDSSEIEASTRSTNHINVLPVARVLVRERF